MATIAESYSVKRTPAEGQIGAHPAFPATATFLFALLLGLGTLAVPVALVEWLVSATRLATLFPSASPPLGVSARAGIALAGAIAGSLIGLAFARTVAESYAIEPRPRRSQFEQAPQCRPISAHDELGEEGILSTPEPTQLLAQKRPAPPVPEDAGAGQLAAAQVDEPAAGPHPSEEPWPTADQPDPTASDAPEPSPSEPHRQPLAELGLLQLTERLGASLSRHGAPRAGNPPAKAKHFAAANADDAARAVADFFQSGKSLDALPGADDNNAYGSPPPMKNPFIGQQEFVCAENPPDGIVAIELAASRLGGPPGPSDSTPTGVAANPSRPPENPPKSVTPAAAAGSALGPGEAVRSLRTALATLEGMGGAA